MLTLFYEFWKIRPVIVLKPMTDDARTVQHPMRHNGTAEIYSLAWTTNTQSPVSVSTMPNQYTEFVNSLPI